VFRLAAIVLSTAARRGSDVSLLGRAPPFPGFRRGPLLLVGGDGALVLRALIATATPCDECKEHHG
jgi:hypothetical protein